MLDFMDYIQLAFSEATNWNRDNSYLSLTTTSQCKSPFRDATRDGLIESNVAHLSNSRFLDSRATTRTALLSFNTLLCD